MRTLSIRRSSLCVCSVHASVPDVYAVHASVLDAYAQNVEGSFAQCTKKYLMRMLSARICSWLVCSVHASVPDAYARRTHKGQSIRLQIFLIIFKIPEKQNFLKIFAIIKWSQKPPKNFFLHGQTQKKFVLKIRLSILRGTKGTQNIKKNLPQRRPSREAPRCKNHEHLKKKIIYPR